MTCSDCIHHKVCENAYGWIDPNDSNEYITCYRFKPKSRYIELPCAVGDKVYWVNRVTKEIETDIVIAIHQYEDGLSITTKTIGTKCTSTYSLDRFLEIMHFTKEEAEKALERSERK